MKLLTKIYLFSLILANTSFAYIVHEFSIHGGGGVNALLHYKIEGHESFWLGGNFGLGYTFFFSENFGLMSGAEMAFYSVERKIDTRRETSNEKDPEYDHDYEFRSLQKNITEKISATLLQIPLMLQFGTSRFYAAAGGKIGIPLSASQNTLIGSMTNSRYYPYENREYGETHKFLGLGTFENVKSKEDISLNTAFFASAEAGRKWKLSESLRLYAGLYFDYGLTKLSEDYSAIAGGAKIKISFGIDRKVKEMRLKAARKLADSLALAKVMEEAPAALKIAEDEELRKKAQREADSLAALKVAEAMENKIAATELQEEIDAIQNQILNDFLIQQIEPNEEQKANLDKIVELLQKHPKLDFFINGHTCDIGYEAVNYRIGMERAKSVQKYIIDKGMDRNRILGIDSKLHYEPLVPNTSEENRKKNRRVEILLKDSERKIKPQSAEEEQKSEDCICQ